jgi:hypothetical protein
VASGANAVAVADKDWLQFTSTTNFSWNDFDTIFDTDTGACDLVSCVIGGTIDLTGCVWASRADVNALFDRYLFSAGKSSTNIDQYAGVVVDALDQLFEDFCPGGRTSRLSRRPGRNVARNHRQRQPNHHQGGGITGARGAPTTPAWGFTVAREAIRL